MTHQKRREEDGDGRVIGERLPSIGARVPVVLDVVGGDAELDEGEDHDEEAPEAVVDAEAA